MDMRQLDINQCPADYHTPNAFKNTHKCDEKSSYVSWQKESIHNKILKYFIFILYFSAFQFR